MKNRRMEVHELRERMKRFGLGILRLADALPTGRIAGIIAGQMVRSGMSVGANYRSACRARSRADFISKMGIVEEELDESLYWLEVSRDAGYLSPQAVEGLMREGDELLSIVVSSIHTARRGSSRTNVEHPRGPRVGKAE